MPCTSGRGDVEETENGGVVRWKSKGYTMGKDKAVLEGWVGMISRN